MTVQLTQPQQIQVQENQNLPKGCHVQPHPKVVSGLHILHTCPISGAAGQNKQHSITKNTAKLDRETEELHHDRVPLEVGKVIQQGRQSKGLTQKDLATVSIHLWGAHGEGSLAHSFDPMESGDIIPER